MTIRTGVSCVSFFWLQAATLNATPFSVTAPGQPIPDEAVMIVPLAIPAGFQQVQITEVEVTGFIHQNPDDIDIYLINPFGDFVEIMSDRGGTFAVSNLTLTYADSAGGPASDNGPLASGLYRSEGLHEGNDGGMSALTTLTPTNDPWLVLLIDDSPGGVGGVSSVTLRGEGVLDAGVPAVSEWGLAILTLLGLVAGTILFRRPFHAAAR